MSQLASVLVYESVYPLVCWLASRLEFLSVLPLEFLSVLRLASELASQLVCWLESRLGYLLEY